MVASSYQSYPSSNPPFDIADIEVLSSAPPLDLRPSPGHWETDSLCSFHLRRDTEPAPNKGIDAETRANPRNFGSIMAHEEGSQMHLIEPRQVPARASLLSSKQSRPSLRNAAHLSRNNAIRRPSRGSAEKEQGPPKMQAANLPTQNPRAKPKPAPKKKIDGAILCHRSTDGKTTEIRITPIKLNYTKVPPSRTPSIDSQKSYVGLDSLLIPRSGLAQEWEESRREGQDATQTWDDIISNRVRCYTWASQVEVGEEEPVSPLTPSPIINKRLAREQSVRLMQNQMSQLQNDREAAFEGMKRPPPTTFGDMRVFEAGEDAVVVPNKAVSPVLKRGRDVPFNAARLTRKVFGVHRDNGASDHVQPTKETKQDNPPPAVLRDTTNVQSTAQLVDSDDQLMKDAFDSIGAQAMRKGRSRTDLLRGLPRLHTDTPAPKPPHRKTNEDTAQEQRAGASASLRQARQEGDRSPTRNHLQKLIHRASQNWVEKLARRAGLHRRPPQPPSTASIEEVDQRPPTTRGKTVRSRPQNPAAPSSFMGQCADYRRPDASRPRDPSRASFNTSGQADSHENPFRALGGTYHVRSLKPKTQQAQEYRINESHTAPNIPRLRE